MVKRKQETKEWSKWVNLVAFGVIVVDTFLAHHGCTNAARDFWWVHSQVGGWTHWAQCCHSPSKNIHFAGWLWVSQTKASHWCDPFDTTKEAMAAPCNTNRSWEQWTVSSADMVLSLWKVQECMALLQMQPWCCFVPCQMWQKLLWPALHHPSWVSTTFECLIGSVTLNSVHVIWAVIASVLWMSLPWWCMLWLVLQLWLSDSRVCLTWVEILGQWTLTSSGPSNGLSTTQWQECSWTRACCSWKWVLYCSHQSFPSAREPRTIGYREVMSRYERDHHNFSHQYEWCPLSFKFLHATSKVPFVDPLFYRFLKSSSASSSPLHRRLYCLLVHILSNPPVIFISTMCKLEIKVPVLTRQEKIDLLN